MLFNSIPFLIFFSVYIFLVFFFRFQWKNITIIFSLFFYAYWNVYLCSLLVAEALFTWIIGCLIESKTKHKKKFFIFGLAIPLLILFIFKYFDFFVSDILKIELQNTIFQNIILPIGISFYTFQAVMYIVDVYKKKLENISLPNFLVFFLFFPNLIAGPLVQPSSFIPQVIKGIYFSYKNFKTASIIILWGFFLKLCISNNFIIYVDKVINNLLEVNTPTLFVSSIFYTFLIYADFAGYSLIAIGIAKIIGLNIPSNFNSPFFSLSLTEFWRRWHISLSKFLRDYLYIPMGGNKFGLVSTCINIMFVMLLAGLWHGASLTFIFWGALHGLFLCLEKINKVYFNIDIKIEIFKRMYVFFLITAIFIPFSLPSLDHLLLFFKTFDFINILDFNQIIERFVVVKNTFLILLLLLTERLFNKKKIILVRNNSFLFGFLITILFNLIITIAKYDKTSFIYFQF